MSQYQSAASLAKIKVDVEDTSFLSSTYFLITNFNNTFGLGKNTITINNPANDLRIEAYDANGNLLNFEKSIENDIINKTQILTFAFQVYAKNISGIGKLIIVGTFSSKLVRYSTNITINTNTINTSKVLFYNAPQIEVTPLLTFISKTNLGETNLSKTVTGSFYSKGIYPVANFIVENKYNRANTDYQIITTDSTFLTSYKNFYAILYVDKIKNPATGLEEIVNDTSSILVKNVINSTTLQLDSPYTYINRLNNKKTVTEIINGKYEILYTQYEYNSNYFNTSSYLTESVDFSGNIRYKKNSIAEIVYRNINTFGGTVQRHKIYKRSLNVPEDYTVVVDEIFSQNEELKNGIVPIKSYQNLGNFYTQDFINQFWFTSSNSINLLSDSKYYINGLNITGSSINDGYIITKLNTTNLYRNATYIDYNENEYLNQSGSSYDCNFIKLLAKTDYVLSFNCNILKKQINDKTDLSFYLIGSYKNNSKEKVYNQTYGVLLANLQTTDQVVSKNFINTLKFKFTPLNDLYGTLIIVPRGVDSLVLNNISIQQEQIPGFSYNTYTIRVPFSVDQPNELFDIKAELYDAGGNLAYSNLRTIKSFDPSGSSSPVNTFDSSTISVGTLNVSYETNLTGSIKVDNFGCSPETDINNVSYVVTWDNFNKNLCVATASLFAGGGGGGLTTGSTYPITSSWSVNSISSSYATTASYALNSGGGGTTLITGSTYPITSSWSVSSSFSNNSISASYVLSSSYAPNIVTSVATRIGDIVLTSSDLTDLPDGVLARINLSIL